jgi:hypothetical protein
MLGSESVLIKVKKKAKSASQQTTNQPYNEQSTFNFSCTRDILPAMA